MTDDGRFEVADDFLFVGRTFEEYRAMFDLSPADLRGRSVLDCPGGPSSFAAVAAAALDARAVAVDPAYGPPASVLEPRCEAAVAENVAQLAGMCEAFVWDRYGDPETRGRYQRAAYRRFLADYARHPGRYLRASLPELPLATDAVDLVLSGNLLFLYDDRLDRAFHRAALRELARVAGEEVRVFTLHSLDRERSALVAPLAEELRAEGLDVRTTPVPYEFQPGATEALVVSGTAGYDGPDGPDGPVESDGPDAGG